MITRSAPRDLGRPSPQLYADLLANGRMQRAGGLSPTSVRRIQAMLRKALRDAIRWGRVEHNVTDLADPPPAKVVAASRRRSMTTWGEDDVRWFLAALESHALHAMWTFAATTGVRRSELLGIRWSDLNLKRGRPPSGRSSSTVLGVTASNATRRASPLGAPRTSALAR